MVAGNLGIRKVNDGHDALAQLIGGSRHGDGSYAAPIASNFKSTAVEAGIAAAAQYCHLDHILARCWLIVVYGEAFGTIRSKRRGKQAQGTASGFLGGGGN